MAAYRILSSTRQPKNDETQEWNDWGSALNIKYQLPELNDIHRPITSRYC